MCGACAGIGAALGVRVAFGVAQTTGSSDTGGPCARVTLGAVAGREMHAYSSLSDVVSCLLLVVTLVVMWVVTGCLFVVRGLALSSKGGCNPKEASRLAAVGQSIRSRAANLDRARLTRRGGMGTWHGFEGVVGRRRGLLRAWFVAAGEREDGGIVGLRGSTVR